MPQPKVSIIVPVYKSEQYLKRCITSLKNQTLEDIEIILVDDASPDNSPRICDEAAAGDSRIKVIHKANEGAGKARNAGLETATGKYIGFVDSDDYVSTDMYEKMCDVIEKYDSDLVMSGVSFVDGNMFGKTGDVRKRTFFDNDTHFTTKDDINGLRLGIVGALPHETEDSRYGMSIWKNLFRHEIIKKNKLKFESEREKLSEDALFMIDYISCIKKATGISDAFYNYCRNGDSISKAYSRERLEKSIVFLAEVEKRYSKDIPENEYRLYTDRFFQAFCRVMCSQEIMHAEESGTGYFKLRKRLKEICSHKKVRTVIKRYPISKLPLTQFVFAFAVRHRLYLMQKLIVDLRNR